MSVFDPYAYLDAAAAALELPIPAKYRDSVAENLLRLHAMAREVIDFPLPADCRPGGRATARSDSNYDSRGGRDPASSDPAAHDTLP